MHSALSESFLLLNRHLTCACVVVKYYFEVENNHCFRKTIIFRTDALVGNCITSLVFQEKKPQDELSVQF